MEQVIRDDYLIEAYELIEMYCSLLSSRFGLIEAVKCESLLLASVLCNLSFIVSAGSAMPAFWKLSRASSGLHHAYTTKCLSCEWYRPITRSDQ